MTGIAQVILTDKELNALILAARNKGTTVSDSVWANLGPKLEEARGGVACPVPNRQKEET